MAALNQEDYEIVRGTQLYDIFRFLVENNTLVKVSSQGHDIERLLLVERIEDKENYFLFKIERTDDFPQDITISQPFELSLEFTGPDQLPYQCKVQLSSLTDTHIWLKSPDFLRRYQLRQNFRIQAPRGAQLKTVIKKVPMVMDIINISVGGILCNVKSDHAELIKKTKILKSIDLVFTLQNDCTLVHIESAEKRRIEENVRPGKLGVAYEFIRIKRDQKRKLIAHIYELQREHLKSRLKYV